MPKAASKLAAAPSTPPARISKAPVSENNPTSSSLPTERTESAEGTVTVLDYGGLQKREAEEVVDDKWLDSPEFRTWKMRLKTEVSHSSQYPRTAMRWIDAVEDAKSISDFIASVSFTRRPIPDFENLFFWLLANSGKSEPEPTRNKSRQPKEKLNQRRGHLWADRLLA